jgi:hypothetical protein
VTPLNVVRGGGPQASPADSGDQNRDISNPPPAKTKAISANVRVAKAATPARQRDALHTAIADVMAAQQAATRGKITPAQFHKQWDSVMADALASGLQAAAVTAALRVLKANNPTKEGWSAEVMDGYLAAMGDTTAHGINAGVVQLVNDYEADDVEEHTADAAFEVAKESTAKAWAYTAITAAAGFGGHDAAKASGMKRKTWIVQSSNPRASHAAMDGETVGIGEEFSNGAQWPGDISLPVEESAGCACGVEFEI